MEDNSFAQIFKAEFELVKLRAETCFTKLWTGAGGARYAQRRRTTHKRRATRWASPACVNLQARYAHAARYALGKSATHIVSEPNFLPLRPVSCKTPQSTCK